MNHRKIAELANVSVSTVSKALSGSREISAELTAEIKRIAIETGYFKEKSRRKLDYLKTKTPMIAVLCPEVVSIQYSALVTSVKRAIEERGGLLAIYVYDFDREKMEHILETLVLQNGADGIILFSGYMPRANLKLPIVCFGSIDPNVPHDTIGGDIGRAMRDIVEYLCAKGHTRIGYVGEPKTQSKHEAYTAAMREKGLRVNESYVYVVPARFEQIGYRAAEEMLRREDRPTAVIAAYDEVALGMIHGLEQAGMKIPDDLSVVGINNIPAAAYAQIPLTTVDFCWSEYCVKAVEFLYDKIFNEDHQNVRHIITRHVLIERSTVAAPRQGGSAVGAAE